MPVPQPHNLLHFPRDVFQQNPVFFPKNHYTKSLCDTGIPKWHKSPHCSLPSDADIIPARIRRHTNPLHVWA